MKKVLIFGLGFQGKKYVNYFNNNGLLIDGVTKSGLNKKNISGINNILIFNEITFYDKAFFEDYNIIIVAVKPYKEQDKIIKLFLKLNLQNKIIVEKSVTYNLDLLHKLIIKENYYFFIDEILFSKFFTKQSFSKLNIKLTSYDSDLFEHTMGFFLLRTDFLDVINSIFLERCENIIDFNILYYELKFGNYNITCNRGIYYLNNKEIGKFIFDKSLKKILSLTKAENLIIKNNFYLLQYYILDENRFK